MQVMDYRGMVGIDGVFAATCDCNHTTWPMADNRQAVATAMMSLQDTLGGETVLGSMPIQRN